MEVESSAIGFELQRVFVKRLRELAGKIMSDVRAARIHKDGIVRTTAGGSVESRGILDDLPNKGHAVHLNRDGTSISA